MRELTQNTIFQGSTEPFTVTHKLDTETGLQPSVFNCADLWQHQDSLLDVMSQSYGQRHLNSFGGSYGWSVRYRQEEDYAAINIHTLDEYIQAFKAGEKKLPYLRHISVNRAMPEIRQYIKHPREFGPNWVNHPWLDRLSGPEFFIGQQGTSFGNIHQDQVNVHVGFVQLQGEKLFVVFPPKDSAYLDIFEGLEFPYQLRNSRVRYEDLNNLEKFPLLCKASPRYIRLRAGQALFLPADWWHTTCNLSDSVSYSVRVLNGSNSARSIASHLAGIPRWINRLAG